MLGDYPGTILLVSHDRDFLDRVATSVIVGEGDGRWVEYAGGYSDMVAQRGLGLPDRWPRRSRRREAASKRPVARAATKRKLSFNESGRWSRCRRESKGSAPSLQALEAKLADADFPVREPDAFRRRDQGLR